MTEAVDTAHGAAEAIADLERGFTVGVGEAMQVRNYAAATIETQVMLMGWFSAYCHERGVEPLADVTREHVERYQRHLFTLQVRGGRPSCDPAAGEPRPLSIRGQHARLWAVVRFFRWCARAGYLAFSPAADLELPRLPHQLPKPAMTVSEVERVLAMPDVTTPNGLRDRAMMEVMYATGMRRAELCALRCDDIDRERGVVRIELGKGRKGRVVPVSARALRWLDRYLTEVWSQFPQAMEHRRLFITVDDTRRQAFRGMPMRSPSITRLMGSYLIASGVTKPGACHIFRHTAATLMMENGADIRAIQDLLGHANIQTTGIYTNVSFKFLKEQHAKTHPSAMSPAPGSVSASAEAAPTRAKAPADTAQPVRASPPDAPPS